MSRRIYTRRYWWALWSLVVVGALFAIVLVALIRGIA